MQPPMSPTTPAETPWQQRPESSSEPVGAASQSRKCKDKTCDCTAEIGSNWCFYHRNLNEECNDSNRCQTVGCNKIARFCMEHTAQFDAPQVASAPVSQFGWRPIDRSNLPARGVDVLLFFPNSLVNVCTGFIEPKVGAWRVIAAGSASCIPDTLPTHWSPLPEPPAKGEE